MTPRVRNIVGMVGFLTAWQLLASLGAINAFLLPSPLRVIEAAIELLADGSLLRHVLASLERVFVGFLLASLTGILIGLLTGWSRATSDLLKPVIESLRPIPPIAWTPIAILWFGVGNAPRYFPFFVVMVFPVFLNTCTACLVI